jgi:nitroreductase
MSAHERYRVAEGLDLLRTNPVIDGLLAHRSVRAYLPEPLPEGTIETLVAAAQSAPSSSNLQVWSVVAVEDEHRKARLAALAGNQKHIVEAPLLLVWLIDFDRLTQLGQAAGRTPHALDYTETFLLGAVDTALAAQNAVVALESLGLGSVYIGGIRNHPAEVAEELGLPSRVFPLVGLAVGKPDPHRPASIKPRLPQSSVLYRERYNWGDESHDAAAEYNARLRAFQRQEALPEIDWTALALRRTAGPESMAGRDRLKGILQDRGFALR